MMTAMICKYCCCCCDLRQHNQRTLFLLSRRSIEFQRLVHPDAAVAVAAAAADVAVAGCDLSDPWPSQEVHENVKVRRWGAEPRNFGFPPSKKWSTTLPSSSSSLNSPRNSIWMILLQQLWSLCRDVEVWMVASSLTKDHFKWTDTI